MSTIPTGVRSPDTSYSGNAYLVNASGYVVFDPVSHNGTYNLSYGYIFDYFCI